MAMDVMMIVYAIFAGMMGIFLIIFLMVIAGRDILHGFKRYFDKKGCYVTIISPSLGATEYYLRPNGDHFKIGGLIYATNPHKALLQMKSWRDSDFLRNHKTDTETQKLATKTIGDIEKSLQKSNKRREEKLYDIKIKIAQVDEMLTNKAGKLTAEDLEYLRNLKSKYETQLDKISQMSPFRESNYYKNSRPSFFYLELDPIPKDFYEEYSELDAKTIDNIISRVATQSAKKQEQTLNLVKWMIYGLLICSAVAAWFSFRNNAILLDMAKAAGTKINM